jgi:iron complex transport system ATP-binding protein
VVPQESHFRFAFSALEVVLMGRFPYLKGLRFEGRADLEAARHAMEATGTLDLAGRSIHRLSGGERQRVLIARALAQTSRIILLDEPTSLLDLKYKRTLFRLILSLSRDRRLAAVVVSHDINLAAQYAHRLVLLKDGCVHQAGKPDCVISAANIEDVYDCPVLVEKNPATGRPWVIPCP